MADYERAGIRVYGVSLDSPESHRRFREKHDLNFPLLTDEGGRASEALGVLREGGEMANRVTFLLDPGGTVAQGLPRGLSRDARGRDPRGRRVDLKRIANGRALSQGQAPRFRSRPSTEPPTPRGLEGLVLCAGPSE